MRCPHCSADQPGGVTVCGFCGAVMTGDRSPYRAAAAAAAAAAEAAPRRRRRWAALVAAALGAGLAAGWIGMEAVRSLAGDPQAAAAPDAEPASRGAAAVPFTGPATEVSAAGGGAGIVRGGASGPLTVPRLEELAERIGALAAEGDSRALAAVVDPRARYRATVEDGLGRRELDGGKAELLAHWLAPWLVAEREGGLVDETIELQSARLAADPRQGVVVRRLESGGDPLRLRYPPELLRPLGLAGALSPGAVAALDLSAYSSAGGRCVATETLRVALAPGGPRVVAAERAALCE
jgi:hypothetical protein